MYHSYRETEIALNVMSGMCPGGNPAANETQSTHDAVERFPIYIAISDVLLTSHLQLWSLCRNCYNRDRLAGKGARHQITIRQSRWYSSITNHPLLLLTRPTSWITWSWNWDTYPSSLSESAENTSNSRYVGVSADPSDFSSLCM